LPGSSGGNDIYYGADGTLTGGDVINGGAGNDSLILSAGAAINTSVATLTSIENITIIDNIAAAGAVAFTTSGGSLASVTLRNDNNAANTTTVNIDKSTVAVTLDTHTDGTVALVYGDAAVAGVQTTTITYIGGKGSTATDMTAAGIEIVNLVASGSSSDVGDLTFDAATTVNINADEAFKMLDLNLANAVTKTLNISGDSKVTATSATTDAALTAINVSGTASYVQGDALGGTAALVVTASGAASLDVITGTATHKITGGSGVDRINIGTTVMTTGTLNGGDGAADIIAIAEDTATIFASAPKARISNFEILEVSSGGTKTFDFEALTGLTGLIIGAATSGVITNVSATAAANVLVTGVQTTALDVGVKSATNPGTNDTLKLTLDHVTANTAVTVAALTIAGVENLQIHSTGAGTNTNTLDLVSAARLSNVTITGDSKFDLTDSADLATELSVNASAVTAATTIAMNQNASGQTITGSATAANTLTGGTGVDIIVGGSADDTINAGLGIGTINLGSGSDTVVMTLSTAQAVAANRITVTGFDVGTDSIDGNGTAFSGSGAGGDDDLTAGSAAANEFATITAAGSVSAPAATVAVVELSFEFSSGVALGSGVANALNGTLLLSALGASTGTTAGTITTAANDEDLFIIAYQGGDAFLYHGNGAGGNTALINTEISLIAVFKGVGVGDFTFADFI
jgi:S-layer protein